MADDVTVHNGAAGTGTSFPVAADDVGSGVLAQIFKLAYSANGDRTLVGADANGLDVDVVRMPKGTKTFTDPAVTSSAAEMVAANASRKAVIIHNAGTITCYLGKDSGVTSSNGLPLTAGATLTDDISTDAWWSITTSGTGDLRICEV